MGLQSTFVNCVHWTGPVISINYTTKHLKDILKTEPGTVGLLPNSDKWSRLVKVINMLIIANQGDDHGVGLSKQNTVTIQSQLVAAITTS